MGKLAIAKGLNIDEVPTLNGGLWRESTLMGILHNEKYTGDMLLQKSYSIDPISKKRRTNKGELSMYHVTASNRPIVSKAIFDEVQRRIAQLPSNHEFVPKTYPFMGKIKCGICGHNYRRKQAAAGTKYTKAAWICSTFNTSGKRFCASKQIPENILMAKLAEILGLTHCLRRVRNSVYIQG